jgi:hypothetical protein
MSITLAVELGPIHWGTPKYTVTVDRLGTVAPSGAKITRNHEELPGACPTLVVGLAYSTLDPGGKNDGHQKVESDDGV